ncbi:MAG: hypothetical protein AAGL99_16960 [Pseudomonadota bacterium]
MTDWVLYLTLTAMFGLIFYAIIQVAKAVDKNADAACKNFKDVQNWMVLVNKDIEDLQNKVFPDDR